MDYSKKKAQRPSQTSMMALYYENSEQQKAVNHFLKSFIIDIWLASKSHFEANWKITL